MAKITSDELKELEGSFPVDGKKTPVTHEPIEEVNSDQWGVVPTQKLQMQLVTLNNRLYAAQCSENYDITRQLERGVAQLQAIIDLRDEDTKLI